MIELKLSAKRYSCTLRLRGKYNIVGGNGGTGKTVVNSKVISGEPQPVKMDWLYPELQVGNPRTVNKLKLD